MPATSDSVIKSPPVYFDQQYPVANFVFFFPDRYKGPKDIYVERVLVTSNAEEVVFLLLLAGVF